MRGMVALLWDPSPIVLELRRKTLPRNWMKALPLTPRQSVNVQPSQGSGTTCSPHLQRLQLVQSFVESSGEMSLVAGNLLKDVLVRQQALPSHVPKIPLHLLGLKLGSFGLPLGASDGSFQQLFRFFVGGLGDLLYNCPYQAGGPALVAFPGVTVGKTRHGDALEQLFRVDFSLGHLIGAIH